MVQVLPSPSPPRFQMFPLHTPAMVQILPSTPPSWIRPAAAVVLCPGGWLVAQRAIVVNVKLSGLPQQVTLAWLWLAKLRRPPRWVIPNPHPSEIVPASCRVFLMPHLILCLPKESRCLDPCLLNLFLPPAPCSSMWGMPLPWFFPHFLRQFPARKPLLCSHGFSSAFPPQHHWPEDVTPALGAPPP